ncbi:MAG: DUF929 family protein [Actinomycetes bacterium]
MTSSSAKRPRAGSRRDAGSARDAVAALRQQEAAHRRRQWIAGASVLVVVVLVGALVVAKIALSRTTTATTVAAVGSIPAPADAVARVSRVPVAVLSKVGAGSYAGGFVVIPKASPLTSSGKPLVVYEGAEYCPYCAAQRWALVAALSRFGTFHGLGATHSSTTDVYPGTNTFSFYGATYSSPYLALQTVEAYSNVPKGNFYAPLQTPTPAQQALLSTYDAPPYVPSSEAGAIPFVDYANHYVSVGASYNPQVLRGLSLQQISAALADPASPVAKAIDGTANVMTAAVCVITKNAPASVCRTPLVTGLAARLGG